MKFGLKLKMIDAVRNGTIEQFLEEISPSEKIDVIRGVDQLSDDSFRAVDASSLSDRYNVYTDILKMSLTQFILLETAIKNFTSEDAIARLIIRPKDEVEFDNTNQEVEDNLISSIYEEDSVVISYVIKSLMHNRDYVLFTKFDGVIYNKIEPVEGEEELEPEEPDTFNERWFWYSIVRALANEDLTKFQFVYDMKMSDVLVEMAYRVQLARRIEMERRAEEARRR